MINPQKAVEWYKNKYPVLSSNKSDYDIYDEIKNKYSEYEYPTDNPFQIKAELNVPKIEELEEKNNPGFIEKVLTANLANAYAGDSDWWAEAYNKSIAGTIYEIKHGTPKYEVDEIDRAWYDEAGQFFVGLMSPIDVLTFFGSGGIGSIAAKKVATEPLKRMAMSGLSKLAGDSTIKKAAATKFGRYLASCAAIESGVSLGTYGAAGAALQDQAQQSVEIKNGQRTERDYLQTTWAATKHGASSLALGSAAGYVTKGLMAPKFAKAKLSTDASFANKITKLTMNPAGQVIAEGSVFGTGQVAERALMGEDIDMDDFLSSIFMNTAVVGGLRASTKVLRIGQDDVSRYKAARNDFYRGIVDPKTGKPVKGLYKDINNNERQSSVAKEIESLKSVEKSFTDMNEVAPREILDRLAKLETEAEVSSIVYDTFEKNLKDYNDLLTEFNGKDIKKLPKKTQVKLLKEAGLINNVMYEFFTDMQANRELGYQAYKGDFAKDKPLTDIHKKQIDKMVDNKVAEYKDVNEMLNAGALNEVESLNKMKKVYGDGFEVSVLKIGEGNFEPILKTPEGSKIKLAEHFKGIKTEKEAKNIASGLNNVYKKVITGENVGINKALGITEKNVEYIPIDAITNKPQQRKSNLGIKYVKKRAFESQVKQLIKQGRAVKPEDVGAERGIDIADVSSTKNLIGEINEMAGDVTLALRDKIKADKIEAKKIEEAEFKRITPAAAFKTPEKFVSAVQHKVRVVSKQYKMNKLNLIEAIAKEADISEPKKFKLSMPEDKNMKDLQAFFVSLDKFKIGDYFERKEGLKRFDYISRIDKKSYIEKQITSGTQKQLLKNVIGVEDGNILKASTKQLKEYNDFLNNYKDMSVTQVDWVNTYESNKNIDTKAISFKNINKAGVFALGPVHEAISKIAPEVSNIMKTHFSIFNHNLEPYNRFIANVKKDTKGVGGKRKYKTMVEDGDFNIVSGKGEKYLQEITYIDNPKLSKKDMIALKRRKKFFENAIKEEWFKTVSSKKIDPQRKRLAGDSLAKKNEDGSYKYINLETTEGRVIEQYINHIQNGFGEKKYKQSIRQKLPQSISEYVIKENDIKWVSPDKIYMPDILTEAGRNFVVKKNIKGLAKKIATEEAKRKYGKRFTEDKIYEEKIYEKALEEAGNNYNSYFIDGKVWGLNKHFKPKTFLQEPFTTNEKGKLVRTYETAFEKTTVPQARSMSKDYATMETAPSYADLKGVNKKSFHNDIKNKLKKRGIKKIDIDWILGEADKQLGFVNREGHLDILFKPVEWYARAASQTILSFPTVGLKALMSGMSDALYAMRVRDIAKSFSKWIKKDSDSYNDALAANVLDIGTGIYTKKQMGDKFFGNLFKLSLMPRLDPLARQIVIGAGKHHQERQLKKIQNYPKNHQKYNAGYRTLKDFYFLSDKQISDYSKYETSKGVLSDKSLSDFNKARKMRDLDIINQKLNTYAHVNTQGSSADLFMPKFAAIKGVKPALIFKRFAYASSDNTIRATKLAYKNKNPFKVIVGTTGKFVTGATMFSIYWNLLGVAMPEENSDWWQRVKTTLWRGEFLGIFGDIFNPYNNGMKYSLTPAIASHMNSVMLEVGQLIEGKSTVSQMGDGLARRTFSVYNNTQKIINRRMNPLNRDKIRIKSLYSQFEEEVLKKPNVQAESSERTPYYKGLESALYLGTEEEYAKQLAATYIAVTHDYVRLGYSWNQATKKANTILKTKFTTMNPNKASLFKSSKEAKMNSLKFINWLQKHPDAKDLTKRLFEIEAEYKVKLEKYNSRVSHYWSKLNIKDLIADFDWTQTKY